MKNGQKQDPEILIIENPEARQGILTDLSKYTQYFVEVLGYTRIGDGIADKPNKLVRTDEDSKLVTVYEQLLEMNMHHIKYFSGHI